MTSKIKYIFKQFTLNLKQCNYSILHQSTNLKFDWHSNHKHCFHEKIQLKQFPNSSSVCKIKQDKSFANTFTIDKQEKRNVPKFASAVHTVSNETQNSTIDREIKIWRQKFHFLKALRKYSHSSWQNEAYNTCSLFALSFYWQKFFRGCCVWPKHTRKQEPWKEASHRQSEWI